MSTYVVGILGLLSLFISNFAFALVFFPLKPYPIDDTYEVIGVIGEANDARLQKFYQSKDKGLVPITRETAPKVLTKFFKHILQPGTEYFKDLGYMSFRDLMNRFRGKPIFVLKDKNNDSVVSAMRSENNAIFRDIDSLEKLDLAALSEAIQAFEQQEETQKAEEKKLLQVLFAGNWRTKNSDSMRGQYFDSYNISVTFPENKGEPLKINVFGGAAQSYDFECIDGDCTNDEGAKLHLQEGVNTRVFFQRPMMKLAAELVYDTHITKKNEKVIIQAGFYTKPSKSSNMFHAYYDINDVSFEDNHTTSFKLNYLGGKIAPQLFQCYGNRCVGDKGNIIMIESEKVLKLVGEGIHQKYKTKIFYDPVPLGNKHTHRSESWFDENYMDIDRDIQ